MIVLVAAAMGPIAGHAAAPEPTLLPPVQTGSPPSLAPALPLPQNPTPVLPDARTPSPATPGEPKFGCPKTRYVNCMPPIKPAQRPLCSKEYKAWVPTHCPGVEFVY